MAYQKIKKEQYTNVGGINQKTSVYVTGERQVLDLVNYDFQTLGSWGQRPGITYGASGSTIAVTPGDRLNFGFQNYRFVRSIGGIAFQEAAWIHGNSFIYQFDPPSGGFAYAQNSTYARGDGSGNAVNAVAPMSSFLGSTATVYVNNAFSAFSGRTYKFQVDNAYFYGLPPYCNGDASTATPTIGTSGTGSLSGSYYFRLCYVDNQAYVGTPGITMVQSVGSGYSNIIMSGFSLTNQATASGATSIFCYMNRVTGYDPSEFVLVGYVDLSAPTLVIQGQSGGQINPNFQLNLPNDSIFTKNSVLIDKVPNIALTANSQPGYEFNTGQARCVEYYADSLFWGTTGGRNVIYYSEGIEQIDDAQTVLPGNFVVAETQDYPLVGLKAYSQSLLIFLQKGVFRLSGDSALNFNQQALSTDYGLVSPRAVVSFKDVCWFLDEKNIMEFNGANFNIASHDIENIIQRMNISAAQSTAVAYHYVSRNEVWFAIPIDGSTNNNIILVYDYDAKGWYTIKSSTTFTMLSDFYSQTAVYGSTNTFLSVSRNTSYQDVSVYLNDGKLYTASSSASLKLGFFGATFKTDYGAAFTLSFKTRYHAEQGPSTTMEWRRFYLDSGPWDGVTLSFRANFYANFATSTISLTRTIFAAGSPYSGPQQARIDFGISAKSLSVESQISTGASIPIVRVYGYTIESRFLRSV